MVLGIGIRKREREAFKVGSFMIPHSLSVFGGPNTFSHLSHFSSVFFFSFKRRTTNGKL